MLKIVLASAILALAAPALATERAHNPQQVSDALKAGCTVQHVHTPAGKTVQSSAIVHCNKRTTLETASANTAPRSDKRVGLD